MQNQQLNSWEKGIQWPYPVNYGKENIIQTDILVIGGGVAGSHAAMAARKKGGKVVLVDKAPVVRSGSGGAGVDHWLGCMTNPCSKITPDEMIAELTKEMSPLFPNEYGSGPTPYILFQESWPALQDIENAGLTIRDVNDEFAGANFRDEETKLMFAYDYENRFSLRIPGANIKYVMYKELQRLDVDMYERIHITRLLTENGRQGTRVIGAMGFHLQTGEWYIFQSKTTILSSGPSLRLWVFSTDLAGSYTVHEDPNNSGDGHAMAWEAGAEFAMMEASAPTGGPFRYPAYGTGNCHNTWYGATMVDAEGKEVPWVDRDGNMLKCIEDRFKPNPGQKVFVHGPGKLPYNLQYPTIIQDLPEKIMKGEYKLPLYADLTTLPELERRAIFGLMVGHEGKTMIAVYDEYTKSGFDPDKDLLQANTVPPEIAGIHMPHWNGMGPPQWRDTAFCGGGGTVVDWNLKTTIDGLYAAGNLLMGGSNHAGAAATGRYAGRNAAEAAKTIQIVDYDRAQVYKEKARVYAPVQNKGTIGWKDFQSGLCRVMQEYCGEWRHEAGLNAGLEWFRSIDNSEAGNVYARNPHELGRLMESMSRKTVGEMMMHASLGRKAGHSSLGFKRLDFPEMDPPEWEKFVTIKKREDTVITDERPAFFWLKDNNAPTYRDNYRKNRN